MLSKCRQEFCRVGVCGKIESNSQKGADKSMREMRFLFNCLKNVPKSVRIIKLVLAVALAAAPFVMHEPLGSEDYLFPKVFIFFPAYLITATSVLCCSGTLDANKLVRSMPIAKTLYTRAVPKFCFIMIAGISCATMLVYFIFLGIIGESVSHFSDTLICGAVVCGSQLIFMPLVADIAAGAISSYLFIAPTIAFVSFIGNSGKAYGLNLPLPAAIALFAGTIVAGAVWAFRISEVKFRRAKVRINNSLITREE